MCYGRTVRLRWQADHLPRCRPVFDKALKFTKGYWMKFMKARLEIMMAVESAASHFEGREPHAIAIVRTTPLAFKVLAGNE